MLGIQGIITYLKVSTEVEVVCKNHLYIKKSKDLRRTRVLLYFKAECFNHSYSPAWCITYPCCVEQGTLFPLLVTFSEDAGHSSRSVSQLHALLRGLWWKYQHANQQQGALPARQKKRTLSKSLIGHQHLSINYLCSSTLRHE